jgi:sec-independent protein translocase protein TatC
MTVINKQMNHSENNILPTAPLHEHLVELRTRVFTCCAFLLVAFIGCYLVAEELYLFLVQPLADIIGDQQRRLIYTGLTEAFFTYMKVAFYSALFISFPVFAWQFYLFLSPGLYREEKLTLLPFLIATPLLFLAGAALVYYQIFPLAWEFFLSFESTSQTSSSLNIQLEARVSEYLSLVIQLIFAFGLAFQLPVLLLLLIKTGLVSVQWFAKKRRHAIVIIFMFAAIFTPPDIISQIGLALPMLLLYECSLLLGRYLQKKTQKDSSNA